ncbi:hypothetical protein ATPR_3500 [Acetobacter tropicalis NBRC 101654]|uniref:Uncharacterized protein n=1 Tax=Acetobacter tropicalis NBRC 101654 TaxID=749388 RepID=F7VJF1_9PROT|nr:hypothetical protein ATPR_3500 [Acetobacter tropicalis NBRC 101654]
MALALALAEKNSVGEDAQLLFVPTICSLPVGLYFRLSPPWAGRRVPGRSEEGKTAPAYRTGEGSPDFAGKIE